MDKKKKFIAAIKENEGFIFRIASVYTNNRDDKNDLVQEIIYQLWKSFDSFNQKSKLSTWIYRVAMNVAIYQLKASKKRVLTVPMEEHTFNCHDPDDNIHPEEQWQLFRKQIDGLNLLDKGIVTLYLEDKSYEEIGEIIGLTPSNVGTKLSRIKEKLRKQVLKHQ